MRFYLGTHKPAHLGRTPVPLFLNRRALAGRSSFPRAAGPWALDSGGYTELTLAGRWELTAPAYAAEVRRLAVEVGRLEWVASRDCLVAPAALEATGGTVRGHQLETVRNYLDDREELGELVRPVLQGWTADDYRRHRDDYARAGVDLAGTVLLGSVAARDDTPGVELLVRELAGDGLSLHVLGAAYGLGRYADVVESADSLAWSREHRNAPPLPGHRHGATGRGSCNNCLPAALEWRERILELAARAGDAPDLFAPSC